MFVELLLFLGSKFFFYCELSMWCEPCEPGTNFPFKPENTRFFPSPSFQVSLIEQIGIFSGYVQDGFLKKIFWKPFCCNL